MIHRSQLSHSLKPQFGEGNNSDFDNIENVYGDKLDEELQEAVDNIIALDAQFVRSPPNQEGVEDSTQRENMQSQKLIIVNAEGALARAGNRREFRSSLSIEGEEICQERDENSPPVVDGSAQRAHIQSQKLPITSSAGALVLSGNKRKFEEKIIPECSQIQKRQLKTEKCQFFL